MNTPVNGGVGRRIIEAPIERDTLHQVPVNKAGLGKLVPYRRPKPTADALRRGVQGRDGGYKRPTPSAQALRDSFGKGLRMPTWAKRGKKAIPEVLKKPEKVKAGPFRRKVEEAGARHLEPLIKPMARPIVREMARPVIYAAGAAGVAGGAIGGATGAAAVNAHNNRKVVHKSDRNRQRLGTIGGGVAGSMPGVAAGTAGAAYVARRGGVPTGRALAGVGALTVAGAAAGAHLGHRASQPKKGKFVTTSGDKDLQGLNAMERASSRGKVFSERELHAMPGPSSQARNVRKDQRYYDPEHRRQRRMGASTAALAGLSGAMLLRGGAGMRSTAKLVRGELTRDASFIGPRQVVDAKNRATARGALHARKRDVAHIAGGLAAAGGAGTINYQGNHERGKHWR